MKTILSTKLFLFFVFVFISHFTYSQQSAHTKIYFLNVSGKTYKKPLYIRTSLNIDNPIKIESRDCVLIETALDTLSFITNGKSQPVFFGTGKTYYYIANSDYTAGFNISETTERAFWLSAHINEAKEIVQYSLMKENIKTP